MKTATTVSPYLIGSTPTIFSYVGRTCGIPVTSTGSISSAAGMKTGSSMPRSGMSMSGNGLKISSGSGTKL